MSNRFYQFVAQQHHIPVTFDPDTKSPLEVKRALPYDRFVAEIAAARAADPELAKVDLAEMMVVKLLDFYKNHFFTWVNELECERCQIKCKLFTVQSASENFEDIMYHARQVEIYRCSRCAAFYRFPRYNDPRKLLQTRRGRCGEWANCFAYILRSLDIPSRLVYCTSDHVWCEFYNRTERRWIHADPCENEYDNPLMYETGWRKKIDLVVARGEREIRDVTWRYTAKWKEVADERRKMFSETRMLELIDQYNVSLQTGLSCAEVAKIQQRWVEEVVEFIRLPGQEVIDPGAKAAQGRKSGSLAWRLSRAETSCTTNSPAGYSFKLKRAPGRTSITYNCKLDRYRVEYQDSSSFAEFTKWSTCVCRAENVFRNVEHDWNMCYLAREKGSGPAEPGLLVWRCEELRDSGESEWTKLEVKIGGQTFDSGVVELELVVGGVWRRKFDLNEELVVKREELVGEVEDLTTFEVHARLSGGSGQVAWQHAQLFRQSTTGAGPDTTPMMSIVVHYG